MRTVSLLDPRVDPEPAWWEAWRSNAGMWANWAWPVLRAGAWTSREPVLLAVLWHDGAKEVASVAGVVAATVCAPATGRRFCPPSGWPRVGYLHVQAPQSSAQPGWWFACDDQDERASLFRAYVRAVRRELGLAASMVLWRQVGERDLAVLPRRLWTRATEPVAVLDTPFSDRAAWLSGLRRSRRNDLKRLFRSLDADPDLEVRIGAAGDVVDATELLRLARLNYDKHGTVSADRHTGMRTLAWHRALLERPEVTAVAYRDTYARLIGAGVILDHPREPLWHSWGAQPVEQGGRRHLYFDLYGRVVELAAARGRRAVVLGKGMATLKADLGARLVPQYAVVSA